MKHLKSEKSCKTKCKEIDIESFDKQLKDWVKVSMQQSKGEYLEHLGLVFASLLACDLATNSLHSFHQNYNLVSIFR